MVTRRPLAKVLALLLFFGLVAVGCGSSDGGTADDSTTTEAPDSADSPLVGMKGTTPRAELSSDFKDRMLEIDPELVDFNYGAESYDAVIVIALAATEAKTDGSDYASHINGITRDGEECTSFADCAALIEEGKDIDYNGVSGPLEFSGNGEPTEASYGVLQFGTNGCSETTACIDEDLTTYISATAPEEADVAEVPVTANRAGDGELVIGSLLPKTGSLAFLGPPEFAGVNLAVKDINDAGGVLGKDVRHIEGDSGDTENQVAPTTVNTLLGQNVDAIIGAASSSVSLSVVDTITTAGVTMFSPANTSKKFSTYDDKGLYFRDAPSDILQGQVLGEVIAGDGATSVYVLALNDDYGTGLADDLSSSLEAAGVEVAGTKVYDPKAADYSAEVQEAKDSGADAIALIGFDESSKILSKMVEQGISLDTVYGVDGNMGNALAENFEAGS